MCFSASASFTASAVLIPVGIYCVSRATPLPRAYLSIAVLPLVFGLQQSLEGLLWLSLNADDIAGTRTWALGYMFFSHFFWLLWIPMSAYLIEEKPALKKLFLVFTLVGAVFGASMYIPVLLNNEWVVIGLANNSISYQVTLIHDLYMNRVFLHVFYAIIILIPLLLSSNHFLVVFGIIILVSVITSAFFFSYAFISIWCFFAAVLSAYILYVITQQGKEVTT